MAGDAVAAMAVIYVAGVVVAGSVVFVVELVG